MSNLVPSAEADECVPIASSSLQIEELPDRVVQLGSLTVHRALPVRGRRLIGPWCFFDRFGPLDFGAEKIMDVAPHPHIGLQTVTWLLDGEIVHKDSLGSESLVKPGQLSLMTAGRGIAHTEETPTENSGRLDGIQLWVALPDSSRTMAPHYHFGKQQPVMEQPGGVVTTILGEFAGATSAGSLFSPGVGAEVAIHPGGALCLPLDPAFEYGAMLLAGDAELFGTPVHPNTLYYLGAGRGELGLSSRSGARLVLIGGVPFGETILIWWNFVARNADEISSARQSWETHEVFGDVARYKGPRLPAPAFVGRPTSGQTRGK